MLKFECWRQVSAKNKFDFGLSIAFESQAKYDAFDVHRRHAALDEGRWKPKVAEFLEIDRAPIDSALLFSAAQLRHDRHDRT
jgi:hypothetical protein